MGERGERGEEGRGAEGTGGKGSGHPKFLPGSSPMLYTAPCQKLRN